jgi:hypothetical protein
MKKILIYTLSIVAFSGIFMSCNQQKSLQELLREEKNAIERFIDRNDFVILKEYPKDGVFKEKEYFKTGDGLYFHVVDSGNSNHILPYNEVTVRYDAYWEIKDAARGDSSTIYNPYQVYPVSFIYGLQQTYTSSYSDVCPAWVIPLMYVGEDAIVDLIVPSSLGSSYNSNSIIPVFFKNVHYTSFN